MPYFVRTELKGPVKSGEMKLVIGVLDAPDATVAVGIASRSGRDHEGRAIWTLRVRGQDIPGRWMIVDGEFQPAE